MDKGRENLRLHVGKSSKVWYAQFRDEYGKRQSLKLGTAVAQARELAVDIAARIFRGESVKKEKPEQRMTFGDFMERHYFPYLRTNRKSAAEMIRALSAAFEPLFKKGLDEITPLMVEEWRAASRERGLKIASTNRTIAYLKAALNWAVNSGVLEKSPVARIKLPKERDSEKKIRFLSADEYSRLRAALVERENKMRAERENHNKWLAERKRPELAPLDGEFTDHVRPLVLLSIETGVRQGAMLALKWGDIDLGAGTITLRGENAKNGETASLPLSNTALGIFSSWREQSKDTRPGSLVFPSPKSGGVMSELKTAWRAALKAAEIENFRWHDLRHTFASWHVMNGTSLYVVKCLMCHSTIKMTERYSHLAPDTELRAVNNLAPPNAGGNVISIRRAAS